MPGLVAILTPPGQQSPEKQLERMLESIRHETFYISGTFLAEDLGLAVGWTALPGSCAAELPIRNVQGDRLLFFAGEPFAHPLTELTGKPTADNILRLYEERGMDAFRLLNGWFHGILVDRRLRKIIVFNDRFGVQRLFYEMDSLGVRFACEAKALLAVSAASRVLNPRSLGEWMACDCVLDNRTLFQGIYSLPGASLWTFEQGQLARREEYFNRLEWEQQPTVPLSELMPRVSAVYRQVMDRYLTGSRSIAVSLTGGLDTRMLMAHLHRTGRSLPCYTFGGPFHETADVRVGRRVATSVGMPHQVLMLDQNFLTGFPGIAARSVFISDGLLSAGESYELYLNRLAREVAPVRLTGNFGSEVMRSVGLFNVKPAQNEFISDRDKPLLDEALRTWREIYRGHPLSFRVFGQAPWYGYGRMTVEQSQLTVRTPFMDTDLVGLMYCASSEVRAKSEIPYQLIRSDCPFLADMPTDRWLCHATSPYRSRVRQTLLEFQFKADYCYKSGMPQRLEQLHRALGPFTPEPLLIGRHRFAHPRVWFRRQLAEYVQEQLLDPSARALPMLNHARIEKMIHAHIQGWGNYTREIDKALTLQLIHQNLIRFRQPSRAS